MKRKLEAACRRFYKPAVEQVIYFAVKKEEGHNFATKVDEVDTSHVIENGSSNRVGWHAYILLKIKH